MLSLCKLKRCRRHAAQQADLRDAYSHAYLFSIPRLLRCCFAEAEAASSQMLTSCHVLTAGDLLTIWVSPSVDTQQHQAARCGHLLPAGCLLFLKAGGDQSQAAQQSKLLGAHSCCSMQIKAKAMRKPVDKMIGLAKRGTLHARRQVGSLARLPNWFCEADLDRGRHQCPLCKHGLHLAMCQLCTGMSCGKPHGVVQQAGWASEAAKHSADASS